MNFENLFLLFWSLCILYPLCLPKFPPFVAQWIIHVQNCCLTLDFLCATSHYKKSVLNVLLLHAFIFSLIIFGSSSITTNGIWSGLSFIHFLYLWSRGLLTRKSYVSAYYAASKCMFTLQINTWLQVRQIDHSISEIWKSWGVELQDKTWWCEMLCELMRFFNENAKSQNIAVKWRTDGKQLLVCLVL